MGKITNSHRVYIAVVALILLCNVNKVLSVEPDPTGNTLRLGVNNFLFWRDYQDGKFSGTDVDIWGEIAKRCKLKLQCVYIPDMESMKSAMLQDSIDVFVGMLRNDEREQYMIYIEPPYRTKLLFQTYTRNGSDTKIDNYDDLYGKKLAVIGGGYEKINNDPDITAERSLWWPQEPFKKLAAGELDAVHINEWLVISYFQDNHNREQFKLQEYSYRENHPSYFVISRQSRYAQEWPEVFGKTIQEMIDDGSMQKIMDKYIPGWYE